MDGIGDTLETQAAAERLATLLELGSRLLESADLRGILRVITRRSREVFRGNGAAVTLYRAEDRELEVVGGDGLLAPLAGRTIPVADTLSAEAIAEDRAVVRDDLRDAGLLGTVEGAERAVVVPLRGREGPIGSLCVIAGAEHPGFSDSEARLLRAFARLAGLAVENARMLQAEAARAAHSDTLRAGAEDHVASLHVLHDAEVAISSGLDLDTVLETVTERARELTGARYAALGVLDQDGDGLARFVTSGVDETTRDEIGAPPRGHGLLGAVIRENRPIRVDDIGEDSRAAGMPEAHPGMGPFLGVPIRAGDRVFGNLYLAGEEGGSGFSERDEVLVSMLAAHAGVAIENAHQYRTLQALLEEVRTTHEQRDRFFAFVNHDLRNACGGVLMWAERLAERATGEEGEMAERIRRGSEHAMRLVRDVLDLEKLSQGRLDTWPRLIRVRDLLESAVDGIRPEAERHGIALRLTPFRADLRMVADPDRVLQVITNLLSNAVKFSEGGTEVRVSAELREADPRGEGEDRWVAIAVQDQGPGIEEEDLERIFGEGVSVSSRRTTRGMGIGLALSRRLAEHMGGALTVASTPGEGSVFTLWVPHGRAPQARSGWIG